MRIIGGALLFGLGAATAAGAMIGMEQLNKNKFLVKKTINDVIDNITE